MIRYPAVEGRFYPSSESTVIQLFREIEYSARYPEPPEISGDILGAILPHAGHVYSGHQTIPFFRLLKKLNRIPETFIILNPNHTGIGQPIALDPHDSWSNSLGEVPTDKELTRLLPYPEDATAHENEHSAEVLIPYIQYYLRDVPVRILPICMRKQSAVTAKKLAMDIYSVAETSGREILVIASSDFSHFLTPEAGYSYDQMVLDRIEQKDIEAVEDTVIKNRISVCGYGPIMTLMAYSALKKRNYTSTVLARGHSGEVHNSKEVVDYISLIFQT